MTKNWASKDKYVRLLRRDYQALLKENFHLKRENNSIRNENSNKK